MAEHLRRVSEAVEAVEALDQVDGEDADELADASIYAFIATCSVQRQ